MMAVDRSHPVALVTGASRGIGRAIARTLAAEGHDVAGVATRTEHLEEVARDIEALGRRFVPLAIDVARIDSHASIVDTVMQRLGRLDLLVNNAGVAPQTRRDLLETSPESYDRVLGVNARGVFFLSQRVARCLLDQIDGEAPERRAALPRPAIIFITSISADTSSLTRAEYCISKAAASQTARLFAERLAGHGINVYEVRPGIIETDMTAPVRDLYDQRIAAGLVPLRRWGQPDDIARAVAALARGDLGYATGIVVELSGGMQIRRL